MKRIRWLRLGNGVRPFGYSMLWTVVFTLTRMAAIQIVSARIGFVTRQGLAANIKAAFPRWVVLGVVGLLLAANTLNVAADIPATAEPWAGWPRPYWR
jgi:Mn2+/Fe2+ NRAMP family transporter